MEKIDWNALRMTVHNVRNDLDLLFLKLNWGFELPEQVDASLLQDEPFL